MVRLSVLLGQLQLVDDMLSFSTDIERLGNPGWNWSNYQKYIARTEGQVITSTLSDKCL